MIKYKKHWMNLIFSGKNKLAPEELRGAKKVLEFIMDNEGGIAFLKAAEVTSDLKVISIDGKLPGGDGYLLNE